MVLLKPLVTNSNERLWQEPCRDYIQSNMLKLLAAFSSIKNDDAFR